MIGNLERTRYFAGRMLTAEDVAREQAYLLGRSRRHNRFLHGWGVITGLDVELTGDNEIKVSPGLAIDCAGNEIAISDAVTLELDPARAKSFVVLGYREIEAGKVITAFSGEQTAVIRESFDLQLLDSNPSSGHKGIGPGTPGCGISHPLCLASVRSGKKGWKIR